MQSRRVRWYDVAFAVVMSLIAGLYLWSVLGSRPPHLPFEWTQAVLSVGFVPCALWWRVKVRWVGIGVALLLLGWAASFWAALPINTGVPPALVMAPLVVYAWTRWLPSRRAGGVAALVAVAGSWLSPAMWVQGPGGLGYRPQQVLLH